MKVKKAHMNSNIIKAKNDKALPVSLIFLVLIYVFNVFTFSQAFYSYYINIILFAVLFLIMPVELKYPGPIIGFWVLMIASCSVPLLINRNISEIVSLFINMTHFLIWPLLLVLSIKIFSANKLRSFAIFSLIIILISSLATLRILFTDINASRLLAGAADEATRMQYYTRGVGGYGYIYGIVFLNAALLMWQKNIKNQWMRLFVIAVIIVNYITILYSSYTIASILSIALFVIALYSSSKRSTSFLIFAALALLMVLFNGYVLELLKTLSDDIGLEYVSLHLQQLIEVGESDSLENIRRVSLYSISIKSFLRNPLLGSGETGDHSQILDGFAKYGMFYLPFILYIVKIGESWRKLLKNKRPYLIYILFFAFMLVNTCNDIRIPAVILFQLPLTLLVAEHEGERIVNA